MAEEIPVEIIKREKGEPCVKCGGMGVVQTFKKYPGFGTKKLHLNPSKYTDKCTDCQGKGRVEAKPNN